MSNEIWTRSATELAAAIRDHELTSREVVEAHLQRIAAVNDAVSAVTVVLEDEALASADKIDAALAKGEDIGPLGGVPMTVKENIDVAGSATTQGLVAMEHAVPPVDAPHIANLRAAGAIPMARTNLPDFGLRWHTDNALRGATRNPWDASRTPGGSSGGEAVALATGMTPLGNGNDLGGSLRLPSQFAGTTALKPTLGRVPDHSALAPEEATPTLQLFAVQGPMARRVADLKLAFGIMSAKDARDPWWTPAPLQGPAPDAPIRVAVVEELPGGDIHPDVLAAVRAAADALRDAGYDTETAVPPSVPEAAGLWETLLGAELRSALLPMLQPILGEDASTFLHRILELIPEVDLLGYIGSFAARNGVAREWAAFFERYPVVVGPVCANPPYVVGRDLEGPEALRELVDSLRLVVALNLLGLPAVAVPTGVANGLPQGVQVIGDRYREDLCLDAAQAIEDRLGTIVPIDPK